MPRKAKVHAVPVEQGEELKQEGLVVAGDVEVKTEAEQLTDVINEVKADAEEVVEPVVEPVLEPVEAKPKAKPKAQAKAKPEPPPEVTPPPVVEAAPARVDDAAKAACPDCGKQMSAKTLKYSHKCTTVKATPVATSRIAEIVEDEVTKHLTNRRAERMAHREAVVEKLMQSAF
jgi:malonyl CoA-acyl carrier protein transacylase